LNDKTLTPPSWWIHSRESWKDLLCFFSADLISIQPNWHKLTIGQSNYNYRLTLPSKDVDTSYFIQVVNLDNQPLLPKVNQPPILQRLDQYPALKPWLVKCYINTHCVRVFKWVDAQCISPRSFDDRFLSSLTDFLIQLHSEKKSFNSTCKSPIIDITEHLKGYRQIALQKSPEDSKKIELCYQHAKTLSAEFVADRLCHNDLNLNNLLWDSHREKLTIIDWEYACYSDPMMDIAGLIVNCQLSKRQEEHLLANYLVKIYLEQIDLSISSKKLSNMKQLFQHISALWQLAHHPKI